jgi:tetratricopeptide (TPR) repeat protein
VFAREADESTELQEALQRVVLYKVNAEEKESGKELAEEFTVKGYPTFVMTNAKGETVNRWWGFDSTPEFLEVFDEAMADPTSIAEKQARFESQPTERDAAVLGQYYLTRGEATDAVSYLETALALGSPEQTYEVDLVLARVIGIEEEMFTVEDLTAAADRALASPHISTEQTVDVARWTIRILADGDDPSIAAPYIAAGLAATEGQDDEDLKKRRQGFLIAEALMVTGDEELAVRLKRETYPEGWQEDPGKLNAFAWWCFDNEVNLDEAEALARQGVKLTEDDAKKAQILDTLAEIVNLRGNRDDAVLLIEQASALDPDNEHYAEQLSRFTGEDIAVDDEEAVAEVTD